MKIEKNVPLRGANEELGGKSDLARQMEIGDSIGGLTKSFADGLVAAMRLNGRRGALRKQHDGTYRVWCVRHITLEMERAIKNYQQETK